MHSQPIRFSLLITAVLCVACGQGTGSDSSSLIGSSAGAGSVATPVVAGAAGLAAVSGASGGAGSSAAGRSAAAGGGAFAGTAGSRASSVAGGAGAAAGGGGAAGAMPVAGRAAPAAAGGGAVASYQPCPADDVCKILPLGDSITYGIGYNGGYRVELFRKAHADGKRITFTGSLANGPNTVDGATFPRNNEGHSGWKIDQLLPLIPMPALQMPPHIVLLMVGTNDIAQNDQLSDAPKRLGGLLDKLAMNAPNALIVVAKLTPLSRSNAVQTYNTAIQPVVQERAAAGKHVLLVDQFSGFPISELGDGVHPNQKGYERMAGVWYQAIAPLLR